MPSVVCQTIPRIRPSNWQASRTHRHILAATTGVEARTAAELALTLPVSKRRYEVDCCQGLAHLLGSVTSDPLCVGELRVFLKASL